jgi:hypothetical protein
MRGNSGHHSGQGDRPYDPMERLHVVAHYSPRPGFGFSKTRPPGLKQFPRCSYPKITPFDYSNSFSPLHFLLSLPLRVFLKKNIVNVDIHTLILLGAPQKTRLNDLKIYETTIVKDDLLSMRYSLPLK